VRCRALGMSPLGQATSREGFHSCSMHSLVEWRDRKSIVTLTAQPTHQFLSPACPACQRAGEMQGTLGTQGPSSQATVEGFQPARHAFVWSVWRDRKSIVTLHNQPINFSSTVACQRAGVRCRAAPGAEGPLVKLLVEGSIACGMHSFGRVARS
jgi:hypothetical protein